MKIGTDFSGIGAPEMALKYLGIDFESVFDGSVVADMSRLLG